MTAVLEDPATTAFTPDPVEEWDALEVEYEILREAVIRATEALVDAWEACADFRSDRYVPAHQAITKQGISTPRLPAGVLPGTSMSGLRSRFRIASGRRW